MFELAAYLMGVIYVLKQVTLLMIILTEEILSYLLGQLLNSRLQAVIFYFKAQIMPLAQVAPLDSKQDQLRMQ